MRYFHLVREKYGRALLGTLLEVTALSYDEYITGLEQLKLYQEKLKNDFSDLGCERRLNYERSSKYDEYKALQEDSFECQCLEYAVEANKKYMTLKNDLKKLVSED